MSFQGLSPSIGTMNPQSSCSYWHWGWKRNTRAIPTHPLLSHCGERPDWTYTRKMGQMKLFPMIYFYRSWHQEKSHVIPPWSCHQLQFYLCWNSRGKSKSKRLKICWEIEDTLRTWSQMTFHGSPHILWDSSWEQIPIYGKTTLGLPRYACFSREGASGTHFTKILLLFSVPLFVKVATVF